MDRLGGQVGAVLERAQDRGALLGEAVARLEESCIDALGIDRGSGLRGSILPRSRRGPDKRNVV
jgi:hypothetical protein